MRELDKAERRTSQATREKSDGPNRAGDPPEDARLFDQPPDPLAELVRRRIEDLESGVCRVCRLGDPREGALRLLADLIEVDLDLVAADRRELDDGFLRGHRLP